jgi:hypothetical protein
MRFIHTPTGAVGHTSGTPAPTRAADRGASILVTWEDPWNTVGAFTPAEFAAECRPYEEKEESQ